VLPPGRAFVDLAPLATVELAERCAAEEARFRQRLAVDERAGLELFRRAIQQRDEAAWELIYQQWKGSLLRWLLQHPAARLVLEHESSESYLTAALSKFWQATSSETHSQPVFETLADILAYLRRCLNSVVLDAVRQIRTRQQEVFEDFLAKEAVNQPEPFGGDLWQCIERALPDARERRLMYLRYVLGYRPREIAAAYPAEFPQVEMVYRMERNVLQRLSRHPVLARWKE
jgi:DNA-directed RNA polymerase specialized sigma24 family protein